MPYNSMGERILGEALQFYGDAGYKAREFVIPS